MKRLTLTQIAERYNRCTKTFLKYVDELGIPHIKLGRDRLFDPVEVDAYLRTIDRQNKKPDLSRKKVSKKQAPSTNDSAFYESLLGLR
jgi:hypothetical protein